MAEGSGSLSRHLTQRAEQPLLRPHTDLLLDLSPLPLSSLSRKEGICWGSGGTTSLGSVSPGLASPHFSGSSPGLGAWRVWIETA